jgi:hypothetical protein
MMDCPWTPSTQILTMTTYFVENFNNNTDKVEVPAIEVIEAARMGLRQMEATLASNLDSYELVKSGNIASFAYTYYQLKAILNTRQHASMSRYTQPLTELAMPDFIHEFMVQLEDAIEAQKETIANLELLQPTYKGVFFRTFSSDIAVTKVFSGIICPDCGRPVTKSVISSHRASMKCMTDTANRDVREVGWVTLNTSAEMHAIKSAGISIELRPSGYEMWIPRWANDAILAYNRDKGFAGLTLAQYLDKMRPNEDKQG